MNIFEAEHPLVAQPPLFPRLGRWLMLGICTYPLYLAGIGPMRALEGNGFFDFVPKKIREVYSLPTAPVFMVPGLRSSYDTYLQWWYVDPTEADRETGWW